MQRASGYTLHELKAAVYVKGSEAAAGHTCMEVYKGRILAKRGGTGGLRGGPGKGSRLHQDDRGGESGWVRGGLEGCRVHVPGGAAGGLHVRGVETGGQHLRGGEAGGLLLGQAREAGLHVGALEEAMQASYFGDEMKLACYTCTEVRQAATRAARRAWWATRWRR